MEGGQSEIVRLPEVDGTPVVIPEGLATGDNDAEALPLGDVFATGHHGAGTPTSGRATWRGAGRRRRRPVRGPAAPLFGPSVVVAAGHHDDRLATAAANAGTHTINAEQQDPIQAVKDLVRERGADAVIETISSDSSLARPWRPSAPAATSA